MKRFLLTAVVLLSAVFALKAQTDTTSEIKEKKGFDKSRLIVGGSFGLSFGNYTLINISPQVGYRFTDNFAAGLGINGQYTEIKDPYYKQKMGVVGMNIFGRFFPIRQVFINVQPELNYLWGSIEYPEQGGRKSSLNGKILPSLLAGAGVSFGGLYMMAQYDLLYKASTTSQPGTPYGNQVFFSIGYGFGF